MHIVPGDWAGWPWRQRLKPHLCSASSQGSMEPPRPQGSRFTALAAGRLVPLRRLHSAHPALCRADPGNWQQEQEGGRAARWKCFGHRQAEGRLPVLPAQCQAPSQPGGRSGHPGLTCGGAYGSLPASSATVPLVGTACPPHAPEAISQLWEATLCIVPAVRQGVPGGQVPELGLASPTALCCTLQGSTPPGDLQGILGRPEGLELRSRTCVPLPPFPRWAPQLPGPATAPHPQILREGPRAGAVHTVRAGFKDLGKPQTGPACPDCVRRMGRKFQYSSLPPPRPVPCVLSTLLLREVGAGESSTAEAQIQKS